MDDGALEVWGGAEYTCNRVGETYFDQMELSGHADRSGDCERFAELGIKTLRFGLLWERHELSPSWQWTDRHLDSIRQAGMMPIAGLVHHGSGPRHTSLLHPCFAPKLAAFAGQVAARYPWIDAYTPVNEPNTTARFSCRYGVWFPHAQTEQGYLRALLNQTKATVLSMKAIRQVRSDARLIQTDDLGQIWSTPELQATCDLLNERRWLSFDLLCGTVDRAHPLFRYIRDAGISEAEILWFHDNPCPPDVAGLNYYVTSDRFLDHRIELYPNSFRSSEGRFVDVEAVRIREEGIAGFGPMLLQLWRRYGIPTAITEVHLGSSVDHQIRWAMEAWQGARQAREAGAHCLAVTFWALLGSYFWNSLVTLDNGHYEPGAFDLRSGHPMPTELARLIATLAAGDLPRSPELRERGWWRQPDRIAYTVPIELEPA